MYSSQIAKVFPASVNPAVGVRVLTMGILGVSVMRLSDRLGPTENADDLATDVLNLTIAGLQAGVALCSQIEWCPLDDEKVEDNPASKVKLVGAMYDVATGRVAFLND